MQNTFYLLVAGSRNYTNYEEMCNVLDFLLKNQITQSNHIVIVSGGARGADTLAEKYADERGYEKHIMPADWNKYSKSAGYRRNEDMHIFISQHEKRGCICFWDMQSRGTQHNFGLAKKYNNPIRVYSGRFLTREEIDQYS